MRLRILIVELETMVCVECLVESDVVVAWGRLLDGGGDGTGEAGDDTGYDNLGLKLGVFQPLDGTRQLMGVSDGSLLETRGALPRGSFPDS